MKSPVFALFGVCSALFGAVRIIHAEVVEGEGDAQSWRLRVLRIHEIPYRRLAVHDPCAQSFVRRK